MDDIKELDSFFNRIIPKREVLDQEISNLIEIGWWAQAKKELEVDKGLISKTYIKDLIS